VAYWKVEGFPITSLPCRVSPCNSDMRKSALGRNRMVFILRFLSVLVENYRVGLIHPRATRCASNGLKALPWSWGAYLFVTRICYMSMPSLSPLLSPDSMVSRFTVFLTTLILWSYLAECITYPMGQSGSTTSSGLTLDP